MYWLYRFLGIIPKQEESQGYEPDDSFTEDF